MTMNQVRGTIVEYRPQLLTFVLTIALGYSVGRGVVRGGVSMPIALVVIPIWSLVCLRWRHWALLGLWLAYVFPVADVVRYFPQIAALGIPGLTLPNVLLAIYLFFWIAPKMVLRVRDGSSCQDGPLPLKRPITILVIGLALWSLLGVVNGVPVVEQVTALKRILDSTILFVLVFTVPMDRRTLKVYTVVCLAYAMFTGGYAFFQWFRVQGVGASGDIVYRRIAQAEMRFDQTFESTMLFAFTLAIALLSRLELSMGKQIALVASMVFYLSVLGLSLRRGAIMQLLVLIMAIVYGTRSRLRGRVVAPVLLISLVGLLLLWTPVGTAFWGWWTERISFTFSGAGPLGLDMGTSSGRLGYRWLAGWEAFLRHPLLGTGLGTAWRDWSAGLEIINQYLTWLVELGIFGTAIVLYWCGALFAWLWTFYRKAADPLAKTIAWASGVYFPSLLIRQITGEVFFTVWMFYMFLLVGAAYRMESQRAFSESERVSETDASAAAPLPAPQAVHTALRRSSIA